MAAPRCVHPVLEGSSFVPEHIEKTRINPKGGESSFLVRWSKNTRRNNEDSTVDHYLWMTANEVQVCCPGLREGQDSSLPEPPMKSETGSSAPVQTLDSLDDDTTITEAEDRDLSIRYDEEMKEDVRRTVMRLKQHLYCQEDLSTSMQDIIESQLRILTEYAGMKCMAMHFQECGAVDLLLQMIAQGDDEHWQTVSEILSSLAVYDLSNVMRILLTMMQHTVGTEGWSTKKVREKQEICLEMFRENCLESELAFNKELYLAMPDVPVALVHSVVLQYLTVFSQVEDSAHISIFPLRGAEGLGAHSVPANALKQKNCFEVFHSFNQLMWNILRIFKWYKVPRGESAGEENVTGRPIVLGQSKRMRLRKKLYKTRGDFQSDSEYGEYIKSVLKRGMRVKAIKSFDGVEEGDIGTFQSANDSDVSPARITWENYGSIIYYVWHNLEILPSNKDSGIYFESAPEDSAAASALSYLLCQKPCNPEDTSGGGATVRTDHWWEVLSAVKALSQESQLHICAMFGAESYDQLIGMQPTVVEAAPVVQLLKKHHPERMVRTYSMEFLPEYQALVTEESPEQVRERVEMCWREAQHTLQPGRDISPYPDPFWEEIPRSSRATISRTIQRCFGPPNNMKSTDGLIHGHTYYEIINMVYRVKSWTGEDSSKQQLRISEVLRVIDKVTFEEEVVCCLSPITDVFQAVLLKDEVSYSDVMSALLLLRLLIARMSSRVEECVLSGSLDLVLRLIELSKGSPLLQGLGLQCLNAHFSSFDLSELGNELMTAQSKGTQAAMMKGNTLLNSILAVLSSLVSVRPVATEGSYKGHLKSMWDATLEISKYINHSLDDWMQSLFMSAISGSTAILGVLMQKDADMCEIKQEWGLQEGLQVLATYAREWDSCSSTISVVDTLLPWNMQAPNQSTCPIEEVETTVENDGETPEFLDVMFLLARQQISPSQFGVLMTMMLKYLGVAHCRHAAHPPSIMKEATVLCKGRVELFVANWGPAAIVDLLKKRKEALRTEEAVNVLRLFVCLANVSSQFCFELVAQGLLTAVFYLLESLCKEHSIVAKWTLCLLWKLFEFEDLRAIMDEKNVVTFLSGLRITWPTLSSNITELMDALPVSVWYGIVTKNRQSLAFVLTSVHDWMLSSIEKGRRDQSVPAIPLFHSYIKCITEGNASSNQVTGSDCWEELSVSNSSYSKYKLTDGQSNTYWESAAEVGKNWIHIKMKPRNVIRKLSITVSSGDRSYVPKVIDVEGGSVPSLVHRIATITVPGSTHGTVVLLKKQDLYYRHIYIRIKECQFGGAATRIRGLDCRCRPVSVWPIFEDNLSSRAGIQHCIDVAFCQTDSPPVLDWFDRLVAAIRFEQELADAYFPTSESRKGLGKAVTASMIDPTVKAIVGTGSLTDLISQYYHSMVDTSHRSQLPPLFSSSSWCTEEAASLSLQPVCSIANEDSVLLMSRIRHLFNFIVQCYDSNSVPPSSVGMRMPWWNAFVRKELSPVLTNIKVTAPLDYIMRVCEVVEKLQRMCRELFADHLVSVAELLGEVGLILKENGIAECVKFCANLSSALHTYLKDPQKAPNSQNVVRRIALLQAAMPAEAVSALTYFYWYHLAIRILRGDMYSLDVETNVLSHISILDYEPKLLLNDVEKSANLMDKFCHLEPLEAVDCVAAHMSRGQALPGLRALYQKMMVYNQGAFSALILASEHCPMKLEVVPDLSVFPPPLRQFCIDYQKFYSTWHHRHVKVHERIPSLQWTLSGWAVVEYRGQLYKVSTAQMLVLMQFNEADSVTPAALQDSTGMGTSLLHKVLSSLTTGRDALLWWKISHSTDVGKNSIVSLRSVKGKGKQLKTGRGCVALSHEDDFGSKLAEEAFEEQGLKQLFSKRQSIIDSMLVHALKKEKRMTVDHIASLVVTACRAGRSTGGRSFDRFECTFDDILASVDRLTFSGYLERDKDKAQVLVYQEEPCDVLHQTHPPCAEAVSVQSSELAEAGRKRRRSANSSQRPSKTRRILNAPSPQKTDSGIEESQFSDLSFLPGSIQWSQTLDSSDLLKHIKQLIAEVAEVTSLSPSEAEVLLHHFKWNKDELLHCYLAGLQRDILKRAGLCPNTDMPHSAAGAEHVECPICLETITSATTLSLACQHKCCVDCWVGHLQTQVSLSQCLQALCPIPDCTVRCTRDMFQTVFAGHQSLDDILHKFSLAVLRSFVDCHPNFTWCCAPSSCDGILQRGEGVSSGLCTKCGWSTCFCCSFTESHEPASCSEMLRWVEAGGFCEGMDDDHKSKLLERTIAKKCPKCYIPIQKNDGCLHMRCKCGYEFCWRCMKAWGPDHTDFFKCSAQISKEAEGLKTFIHCNSKCMEYHKSKKFAADMCIAVLMTPVRWLPHSRLLLLAEACLCLKECYKDLAYAQVAKYLKPKDSLDYLTHQMNVMESDTKALQVFLDSILVKVPPVVGMAAMSELHGTECLKMIRRLCRVHGNLVLGAQQHYQILDVCSTEPCSVHSTATLMTRDQTVRQQDRATQHAGPSVEASTDEYPVSYIPALPVPPLSDDSSQLLEIDSDIDDDREEECAISDLEDDYSDHDSSDFENEEQYSSDGDGIYDSEDQHCSCEGCRNVNFF